MESIKNKKLKNRKLKGIGFEPMFPIDTDILKGYTLPDPPTAKELECIFKKLDTDEVIHSKKL